MAVPRSRSRALAVVLITLALFAPGVLVPGALVSAAATDGCRVHGDIGAFWTSVGGNGSFLGPCVTDEQAVPGGVRQRFRSGSVLWSPVTGARSVHGAIEQAYDRVGGPTSRLGLPTTHELATPTRPGAYSHFQGGSIYWSAATGAHLVVGAVRATWSTQGWENGPLGFPLSSEAPSGPGVRASFEGGIVAWSPATGAHAVRGAIGARWSELGAERGPVGFPVTSELATPIKLGAFNHFRGGSIYWSPRTGAHLVLGAIRDRWAALGWEGSALGFPVSSEYAVPGGARSDFSGGSITWDGRTGAVTVHPGPRPSFHGSVHPVSAADLPSSWRPGCPVGPADLRLLQMSHVDLAGADRTGELVVHVDEVLPVLRVFARLHEARFPVARMQRVDVFGGSDEASMDANNTSAFNCRRTTGGSGWSEHAYGRAIDLNPVQNPYVSGTTVLPEAGRAYLDRSRVRPGMAVAGSAVVHAFASQGWGWGGSWTRPRDYQHFSRSGR